MHVVGHAKTDVGKKRAHNEDYMLTDADLGLYVVCDGMGGHAAGEVASEHAARTVHRIISENRAALEAFEAEDNTANRDTLVHLMEKAVQTACFEIYNMAVHDAGKAGMGTTLEAMLVVGGKGLMGHVGDSRLYMVRSGQLHQLSEDHSYCTEMVKRGKMTREEARVSPYANVITRAVGIQESVQVDTLLFDVIPGDTFLLCSDGLSGYTEDANELAELLAVPDDDVENVTDRLIDLANERGGKDNITAVVLRAYGDGEDLEGESARAAEVNLKLETLKRIPLFRHLTYQELVKVLNVTYIQRQAAGETIITEGEKGEELYVVLGGAVTVSRQGQEIVDLSPGVHFGEMALVDQSPRSATISAKIDSRLLVLQRRDFYNLIRKEPVLAVKLLWSFVQVLSHRLRDTNDQLSGARTALEQQAVPFFDVD